MGHAHLCIPTNPSPHSCKRSYISLVMIPQTYLL